MPSTLTRPARHDGRSRPTRPADDAQPYIPWRLHAHNPRPAPLIPDPGVDRGRPPAPWPTQCRDCWGFVDDPHHLSFPA
jgi:hypothetical protein